MNAETVATRKIAERFTPTGPVDPNGCLVMIWGPEIGKVFKLEVPLVRVGRSSECEVSLGEAGVSRIHARIARESDTYSVEDLNSTNGTYVNHRRVYRQDLHDHDLVNIGGVIFKFLSGGNLESRYHEEMQFLTMYDGLTGVHSRRYFTRLVEREIERCKRY